MLFVTVTQKKPVWRLRNHGFFHAGDGKHIRSEIVPSYAVTVPRPAKIQGKSVLAPKNRGFFTIISLSAADKPPIRQTPYYNERRALNLNLLDRCVNGDMRMHGVACFSSEVIHFLCVGAHSGPTRGIPESLARKRALASELL